MFNASQPYPYRQPRRPAGRQRNKSASDYRSGTATPVRVVSAVRADGGVRFTFDTPVVVSGVPNWKCGGKLPTSAKVVDGVLVLAYDGLVSPSEVILADNDPAVRSTTGGTVAGGRVPLLVQAEAGDDEGDTGNLAIAA